MWMRVLAVFVVLGMVASAAPAKAGFGPPETIGRGLLFLTGAASGPGERDVAFAGINGFTFGNLMLERGGDGVWAERRLGVRPERVATAGSRVAVAWQTQDTSQSSVSLAVTGTRLDFFAPWTVAVASSAFATTPAVAVDARGDAVVAFAAGAGVRDARVAGVITVAYRRSGGALSPPIAIGHGLGSSVVVALGEDGRGLVAWRDDRDVVFRSIRTGGRVGATQRVATCGITGLTTSAGPHAAATVAWADGCRGIRVLRRAAPGAFASRSLGRGSALVSATDESGRTTIAWAASGPGGSTELVAATASIRGRFGRARRLGPLPGPDAVFPPQITARRGLVAIAWTLPTPDRLHAAVFAVVGDATALGGAEQVDTVRTSMVFSIVRPAVALDGTGRAIVVYGTTPEPVGVEPGLVELRVAESR